MISKHKWLVILEGDLGLGVRYRMSKGLVQVN